MEFRSNDYFNKILDNIFDGVYISDGKGNTLFINEAYTRITGIKREEVVGRNVKDILEEGRLYKGAVTLDVINSKNKVSNIGKIIKSSNKNVLVSGSPILNKNQEVDFVVVNIRDISELKNLEEELENLKKDSNKTNAEIKFLRKLQTNKKEVIYKSESMKGVIKLINTIAPTNATVLITGESGTGKEIIADEIFNKSLRNKKPFIKVNCAAIPGELLEAELFGYEGGAFTGSKKSGKIGMFELANEGTILLDEIGDMPLNLQVKLLRFLQEREIIRIGGNYPIKLDIRIIASTNQDLKKCIEKGEFREDLFYRLNVLPIKIAPLRKRKEDISLIAEYFNLRYNRKYNKNTFIENRVFELLEKYSWPGNIRELKNFIERMVIVNTSGRISEEDSNRILNITENIAIYDNYNLKNAVFDLEKKMIEEAIKKFGSTRKAAPFLGIDQSTIVKKAKQLGINLRNE